MTTRACRPAVIVAGGKGEVYKAKLDIDESIVEVTVDEIIKRWRGNDDAVQSESLKKKSNSKRTPSGTNRSQDSHSQTLRESGRRGQKRKAASRNVQSRALVS